MYIGESLEAAVLMHWYYILGPVPDVSPSHYVASILA